MEGICADKTMNMKKFVYHEKILYYKNVKNKKQAARLA